MTRHRRAGAATRRLRRAAIAAALAGMLLLPATASVAATGDEEGDGGTVTVTIPGSSGPGTPSDGEIDNAEFRWGINVESGSGAFAGGCNFLSAGKAADSGGAKAWTESDRLYSAASGAVRIVKANADGGWSPASFATRCLDRTGRPVAVSSVTSHTESQVVISGGTGTLSDAGVRVSWKGSFTAAFYGGMVYWSATDPVLTLDAKGNGQVTATLSGFATDRENMGAWAPIPPRSAVIAEIRGAKPSDRGFAQAPEYLGVVASVSGQAAKSVGNIDHWGAFPSSFLSFQEIVGAAGYWMTTGGQRDRAKVPTTLYVSYDAAAPVVTTPGAPPPNSATPTLSNPLSQRAGGLRGGIAATAGEARTAASSFAAAAPAPVVRDDGTSLIPQLSGAISPYVAPVALTVLSLLVGVLSVMHLAGAPLLPWIRKP